MTGCSRERAANRGGAWIEQSLLVDVAAGDLEATSGRCCARPPHDISGSRRAAPKPPMKPKQN
jgi:hypothetical protein